MRVASIGLAIALATPLVHATCTQGSGALRSHLVELYTSEGCSSCPPADAWLAALPDDPHRVLLAFHVDYWDSPAWTDRFADPRHADRQRELAAHMRGTVVYTPEMALDGREWRDWNQGRGAIPATATDAAVAIELRVEPAPALHVSLAARPAAGTEAAAYAAYFAVGESGLASMVKGGENRGTTLRHDHVVRAFAGPFTLDGASATMELPADLRRDRASVVAFVQRIDDGEVVNVVAVPLAGCMRE